MKNSVEGSLGGLVASLKKWSPPGCPWLFYPEDVKREFEATLACGRWWMWLPCWAFPMADFAREVALSAAACRVDQEEFARRILEAAAGAEGSPAYVWLGEPFTPMVAVWDVVQAVEAWIFYDLRPALRTILELELDCRVG